MDGEAGKSGEPGRGGSGGSGGAGGAGGEGFPGGAGGAGGAGGGFRRSAAASFVSHIVFVVLVILVPVLAGMVWSEHQRVEGRERLREIAHKAVSVKDWQVHDSQVAMCERINIIRRNQNAVIAELSLREDRFQDSRFRFKIKPTPIVDCDVVIQKPPEPRSREGQ